MTTTIFDVTPEEIESSAVKVENKTKEFVKAYDSIYAAVSDLRIITMAKQVTLSSQN